MTPTLTALFAALNAACDAHPYAPLHPARVAAREALWFAQHPDWRYEAEAVECPF